MQIKTEIKKAELMSEMKYHKELLDSAYNTLMKNKDSSLAIHTIQEEAHSIENLATIMSYLQNLKG